MYRPMTATEKQVIQIQVEEVYNTFIGHVAEGRSMSIEQVDSIGQGRVWSGINAKEIGLIDEIGGLRKAVDIAIEKAGLEEFRLVTLPKQEDPFEMFIKELTGETETSLIKNHLGESYRYYIKAKQALKVKGVQARLPYMVDFY